MTRTRRSLIAALLVLLGCRQGWHQVARPSAGGSLEGNPEVVRVTRTVGCGPRPTRECVANRGTLTLYNPRVKEDSLVGYYDSNQRERIAIHLRDVVSVESRKVDVSPAGVALGAGKLIALAAVAAIALIALATGGSP